MGMEIDIAVVAGEAHGEPFLALAAILAVKGHAHQMWRQIIGHPVGHLANDPRVAGAGLFLQFAQRRCFWLFALVDAALGHLPALDGLVDPFAHKHQALAVQKHHTHGGPVRKRRRHQKSLGFARNDLSPERSSTTRFGKRALIWAAGSARQRREQARSPALRDLWPRPQRAPPSRDRESPSRSPCHARVLRLPERRGGGRSPARSGRCPRPRWSWQMRCPSGLPRRAPRTQEPLHYRRNKGRAAPTAPWRARARPNPTKSADPKDWSRRHSR